MKATNLAKTAITNEVKRVSVVRLTEALKELVKVHIALNDLAKQKTDCVIKGDISNLNSFIQKEAVHIKQLQVLETARIRAVSQLAREEGFFMERGTIQEILPYLKEDQKKAVELLQKQLLEEVIKLKYENDLNRQLIEDSLRFVNLSLDMMQPEEDSGNYTRSTSDNEHAVAGRPIFDSKA